VSRKSKHYAKVALIAVVAVLGYDFYKGHTKGAPVAGPRVP
jgi:hypothetical protein